MHNETLFINIAKLVNVRTSNEVVRGKDLATLPILEDAFLLIEDGIITDFGAMFELEIKVPNLPQNVMDVTGKFILPCWCDSHTHIVFAGSRENEFVDKIRGASYAEIAANGGGILNSAKKLNETTEDELYEATLERLEEIAELDSSPGEQYERLRTLNSISERPDELLVLFARVPENTESWYAIMKLAEKKKKNGAIYQDFYDRLQLAEKKAIESGEFSVYNPEASMSQIVKVALGAWATVSVIHYNPGLMDPLFWMVQAPLKVFGF